MTINAHTANRPFSRAPGAQSCRLGSKGRAAECFLRLAFFHTLLWTLSGPCKHWGAFDVAAAGCGRLLMDIYQIRSRSYCATRMFFFFFLNLWLFETMDAHFWKWSMDDKLHTVRAPWFFSPLFYLLLISEQGCQASRHLQNKSHSLLKFSSLSLFIAESHLIYYIYTDLVDEGQSKIFLFLLKDCFFYHTSSYIQHILIFSNWNQLWWQKLHED